MEGAGVRFNDANIDGKNLVPDQPGLHALTNNAIKYLAEHVAIAETAMPVDGEGLMIGKLILNAETTEPPIGKVEVNLLTQQLLGTDSYSNNQPTAS